MRLTPLVFLGLFVAATISVANAEALPAEAVAQDAPQRSTARSLLGSRGKPKNEQKATAALTAANKAYRAAKAKADSANTAAVNAKHRAIAANELKLETNGKAPPSNLPPWEKTMMAQMLSKIEHEKPKKPTDSPSQMITKVKKVHKRGRKAQAKKLSMKKTLKQFEAKMMLKEKRAVAKIRNEEEKKVQAALKAQRAAEKMANTKLKSQRAAKNAALKKLKKMSATASKTASKKGAKSTMPQPPAAASAAGASAHWVVHSQGATEDLYTEHTQPTSERRDTLVTPLDEKQATSIEQEAGQMSQPDFGGLVLTENGKYDHVRGTVSPDGIHPYQRPEVLTTGGKYKHLDGVMPEVFGVQGEYQPLP